MIDFKNGAITKLKKTKTVPNDVESILIPGETIIGCYQGLRDSVVFTDKRVISINVQGLTGKKVDYTSMPYSKVSVFSVETAGKFDLDAELELYFSGVGQVHFDFTGDTNIKEIGAAIASYVLK